MLFSKVDVATHRSGVVTGAQRINGDLVDARTCRQASTQLTSLGFIEMTVRLRYLMLWASLVNTSTPFLPFPPLTSLLWSAQLCFAFLCVLSDPIIMAIEVSAVLAILSDAKYLTLVLFIVYVLWQQWQSYRRLSQFKGPLWAGITNLWLARSVSRKRAHLDLYEAYLQYGSL